MRHMQKASTSQATLKPLTSIESDAEHDTSAAGPSSKPTRQRCPCCGDPLPTNASLEYMARHRQSIGYRLGLNAPISSASASEAPSPSSSEPPTPARAQSLDDATPLGSAALATHQRETRLPRRLSNAPRWKKIAHDNVSHTLLSRMGWKEGMGLGVQEWKVQQNRRDRIKRQRSNAIRALLQRQASVVQTNLEGPPLADVVEQDSHTDREWMEYLLQQNAAAAQSRSSSL